MPVHYEGNDLTIYKTVCGSFANNAYLVVSNDTNESIIIDTPGDPQAFIGEARGTNVRGILITHNHWDHLAGFEEIHREFDVPVGIGAPDAPALADFGVTRTLDVGDGAAIKVGSLRIRCLFTPGHTPGSTCYVVDSDRGAVHHLFSGDTLFPGGPGKSRSPAALQEMLRSITTKLYRLPDETNVYPGHGDDTTIGDSKQEYAVFSSKSHPADLHGDVTWLE